MLYDLTYLWNLRKAELIEAATTVVVARGWGQVGDMGRCWSKGKNSQL